MFFEKAIEIWFSFYPKGNYCLNPYEIAIPCIPIRNFNFLHSHTVSLLNKITTVIHSQMGISFPLMLAEVSAISNRLDVFVFNKSAQFQSFMY